MIAQDPNENDSIYIHLGSLKMGATGRFAVLILSALIVCYFVAEHYSWL